MRSSLRANQKYVGVDAEGVAGEVPAVDDVDRLAFVVEVAAAGRAADREAADLAWRDGVHGLVDHRGLVARDRSCRLSPGATPRRGSR